MRRRTLKEPRLVFSAPHKIDARARIDALDALKWIGHDLAAALRPGEHKSKYLKNVVSLAPGLQRQLISPIQKNTARAWIRHRFERASPNFSSIFSICFW